MQCVANVSYRYWRWLFEQRKRSSFLFSSSLLRDVSRKRSGKHFNIHHVHAIWFFCTQRRFYDVSSMCARLRHAEINTTRLLRLDECAITGRIVSLERRHSVQVIHKSVLGDAKRKKLESMTDFLSSLIYYSQRFLMLQHSTIPKVLVSNCAHLEML